MCKKLVEKLLDDMKAAAFDPNGKESWDESTPYWMNVQCACDNATDHVIDMDNAIHNWIKQLEDINNLCEE